MDMERIRAAAGACYSGLTVNQKQAAQRFFRAMDSDNNGRISIDEFMSFLTSAGFQSGNFYWLFLELDRDKNGTLDFGELFTFYYIFSRDEYRDLLRSRANTRVPRREIQRADWADVLQRFNEFQAAVQIGQTVVQVVQAGCSIL